MHNISLYGGKASQIILRCPAAFQERIGINMIKGIVNVKRKIKEQRQANVKAMVGEQFQVPAGGQAGKRKCGHGKKDYPHSHPEKLRAGAEVVFRNEVFPNPDSRTHDCKCDGDGLVDALPAIKLVEEKQQKQKDV